jgi:hypothetical protein
LPCFMWRQTVSSRASASRPLRLSLRRSSYSLLLRRWPEGQQRWATLKRGETRSDGTGQNRKSLGLRRVKRTQPILRQQFCTRRRSNRPDPGGLQGSNRDCSFYIPPAVINTSLLARNGIKLHKSMAQWLRDLAEDLIGQRAGDGCCAHYIIRYISLAVSMAFSGALYGCISTRGRSNRSPSVRVLEPPHVVGMSS